MSHRASASPGYCTQPLHWHQSQNRHKRCQKETKSAKKNGSKRGWFRFYYPHTSRESVSPVCGIFWMASLRYCVEFWRTFVMSTTSNQFEGLIFRSNLTKLLVATQDDNSLHSSYFPEIPGRPKCTFSSLRTFKLSSGEPKVIQLVAWYHVLFLVPWTIHFLFQNTW